MSTTRSTTGASAWKCHRCNHANDTIRNKKWCSSCWSWKDGIAPLSASARSVVLNNKAGVKLHDDVSAEQILVFQGLASRGLKAVEGAGPYIQMVQGIPQHSCKAPDSRTYPCIRCCPLNDKSIRMGNHWVVPRYCISSDDRYHTMKWKHSHRFCTFCSIWFQQDHQWLLELCLCNEQKDEPPHPKQPYWTWITVPIEGFELQ